AENAEGAKQAAPTAEGCSAQTATADRCASSKETADPRFDEQRKVVERSRLGLPRAYICQLIVSERTGKPISLETLESAFRAELDRGMAQARRPLPLELARRANLGSARSTRNKPAQCSGFNF